MNVDPLPRLIQGGMGIGVSNWRLARAVSKLGHLGVVSGTALDVVLARRLQQGDPGGHMLRALGHFPRLNVVLPIIARFYPANGAPSQKESFRAAPMPRLDMLKDHEELLIAANFVEVYLAREKQSGVVGINLMEKIQFPTLAALYGAMLAGVDYVLMGAGIPNHIPAVLDALVSGQPATLKVDVAGSGDASHLMTFDPWKFWQGPPPALKKPKFIPIVSSVTLALSLAKKSPGNIAGFIVEDSTAGGHNAPPRGPAKLNARGEPLYGPRDLPDLERFRKLGYPFWLAGSYWGPGKLEEALAAGAVGIQVGTPFAFCEESGIAPELKEQVLKAVSEGKIDVFTDPLASPTGFPFKIVQLEGTVSSSEVEAGRNRVCDIGLLRQAYLKSDGTVGYRCASESVNDYVRKGGKAENTRGRKCICNGLLATVGLGQIDSSGKFEPPLVTAGDSLMHLRYFLRRGSLSYSAADVVEILLAGLPDEVGVMQT
ncbi:MAG: nitronate monooxygenase [Methylacidiphilales bacterium]|nr:nitronate monooxygenase [Candidatus Methylacidiphilales bacterium]